MCVINKKNQRLNLTWRLGLSLTLWLFIQSSDSYAEDALQAQQQIVRDLILAETQQLQTQQALPTKPKAQIPSVFEGPDLVLHALYGVGQRLMAEVSFKGVGYLYLRGQHWPLGDQQGRSQLRLLDISSRCISLAHKEQHFDACVSP